MIGGGIAGCGAAWSLHRAGFEVELFEAGPTLGGNAKTHAWQVEGGTVTTGLSVLAWPGELFRNYRCLLAHLNIATEPVELRFLVRSGDDTYVPGCSDGLARRFADDFGRWRRMVAWVARINHALHGQPEVESLYHASAINPLGVIPLRDLARAFGISSAFWAEIVVPLHSATFLTTDLDRVPALIVPIIDAIVPLDRPAALDTWSGDSREVFARMVAPFAARVHTRRPITRVSTNGRGLVIGDARGEIHHVDKLVVACSFATGRSWLDDRLRRDTRWSDDGDPTFRTGIVHDDATVIPPADRSMVLDAYCNYVVVAREPNGPFRYENHFVLSSWLPAARGHARPMLVSYANGNGNGPAPDRRETSVDNRHAHPELCVANLARALLHRRVQGRDGIYYCGALATPGNGHDLSLLSGLVVAEQLGAPYPFADDVQARADFERLRRIMISGPTGTP